MRLHRLLALPTLLAAWTWAQTTGHAYNEHLELTPLSKHHLHADFTFNATTPLSAYESHHYRYFPRSLAQILQSTHTTELHLRFALGRWQEQWGPRPQGGRREGGTGVEIWAWLEGEDQTEIEQRWSALVNSLSGLFCASLNFIDGTRTTSPALTFEPEGTLQNKASTRLMHGLLPREVICTENLTPFLKLLPCKGKAGISSLLDGHKLFDSTWQSMSIDVKTVCSKEAVCNLEIEQSISMALSIPRSMKARHDPIPRPVPREEIECDQSKSWNSHDSCFPKPFDGEMAWVLSKVFGRPVRGSCGLQSEHDTAGRVTLNTPREREVKAIGASTELGDVARHFRLEPGKDFDLNATRQHLSDATIPLQPLLFVSRQMTGHGQEMGGMQTIIRNPHAQTQRIVFFESLPWFIRPFMHTLSITGATVEKMYYTPLIDRKRGSHIELLLSIPAESSIILEYEVEKAILRYTEYPPDANRGFDIGAAVIRVLSPDNTTSQDQYLRTTSLLLPLPTPDFSMPYNVIILTSTVIALGFGSIFNLLVRKFVLLDEVPESPFRQKIKQAVQNVSGRGLRKPAAVEKRRQSTGRDEVDVAEKQLDKRKQSTVESPGRDEVDIAGTNGSTHTRQRKQHDESRQLMDE